MVPSPKTTLFHDNADFGALPPSAARSSNHHFLNNKSVVCRLWYPRPPNKHLAKQPLRDPFESRPRPGTKGNCGTRSGGKLESMFCCWSALCRFPTKVGPGTVSNGSGSKTDKQINQIWHRRPTIKPFRDQCPLDPPNQNTPTNPSLINASPKAGRAY